MDESENTDFVVDGKKRKNDEAVEKEKKKKKNKHEEIVETEKKIEEVVEKVKKKKKNKSITESTDCNGKPAKVKELPTVTIAVPGSILDNAQSPEFRTYLAGQIARAACIYKIDEVC